MVFEFVFSSTKTKAYMRHFIDFLHYHIANRNLKISDCFSKDLDDYFSYHLYIDTYANEVLEFAQFIAARLPISIDFSFVELKTPENISLKYYKPLANKPSFPDALEIKEILNKDSQEFCDLFDWVKNIVFSNTNIMQKDSLIKTLKQMALVLKNGGSLIIRTARGNREFSFVHKSADVMFWDLSNILTYMRIQNIQSNLLASYEKPSTKLCPKEVFAPLLLRDKTDYELNVMLPDDLVLSVLGLFALELDMGYAFFKKTSKAPQLSYEHYSLPKQRKITISESGLLIDSKINKDSKSIFDILDKHSNITIEKTTKKTPISNQQRLIVFLSQTHPTKFWIQDGQSYKDVLTIAFEANPRLIVEQIKQDYKDGDKLLRNFERYFGGITSAISSLSSNHLESKNLIDIFCSASFVLGYLQDFRLGNEVILNNAKKFVRDKGPRIDFKLIKEDGGLRLDYPKAIRSAMSFLIAGLDEATLSYGFIDSMTEFIGNFVSDMSINFNIKNVFISGDMLTQKIFLDKMLHYLPKNINLTLPKEGYIDYS